jgi:hypothetical protein
MTPECLSPHVPETATSLYPEPDQGNPHLSTDLFKINFNVVLNLRPGLKSGVFTSDFLTKTLYANFVSSSSFAHATFPVHLILLEPFLSTPYKINILLPQRYWAL